MTQPFRDRVVLFDRWGLQASAELSHPGRLTGDGSLVDWLQRLGADVRFGDIDDLDDVAVLLLTTRSHRAYTPAEIESVHKHVRAGGGLLCCSNHGSPDVGNPVFNATRFDLAIASTYFALLEPLRYRRKPSAPFLEVVGPLRGDADWPGPSGGIAHRVLSNNCCAVLPGPFFQPSVSLAGSGLTASVFGTSPPPDSLWSATLQGGPAGDGRVVLCADSGWLGNDTSNAPGPGLFQQADNAQYALNAIRWLLAVDGD